MSSQNQKDFLTKIRDELLNQPGSIYRKETADFRAHVFVMTRRAINRGIKDTLLHELPGITQTDIASIQSKVAKSVGDAIENTRAKIQGISNSTVYLVPDEKKQKHRYRLEAVFEEKGTSRYAAVYASYTDYMQDVADALSKAVKEVLKKEKDFKKKELWNLEHNKFEGVLESQVKDAIDSALAVEEQFALADLDNFFKSRGVSLKVYRNTKTSTMNVHLGTFRTNIKEGAESKARKKKLVEQLEIVIDKLEKDPKYKFATLPGSDSFKTIKRKKAVSQVIEDPFSSLKTNPSVTVKLKVEDTKIKHSTRTVSITDKGKTSTHAKMRKKQLRRKRMSSGNSPASMPLKLMAVLNRELPRKIAQNMGSPALNYRSGRFAASVRVTDVVKTPQGYPSIGYTYMKYPYQTFEPGYAQGDPERDPRKLINKSIREIAAEFAIGRFYTRRV